jgi:cytochrome b subunit of formate dehydrogenase
MGTAIILALLAVLPAFAGEVGNDECLACHGSEGFASPTGKALYTDGAAFGFSAHAALTCTSCHADIESVPHAEKLKAVGLDTCATCHDDAVSTYRESIHGRARANGAGEAATCTNCHGNIHTITAHTEPTSAAHWSKLAATCAHCHANLALVKKYRIPVVQPVEAYLASAHAQAVANGKRAAVCSDCHGAHDIQPSTDPRSFTNPAKVPDTCGKCHGEILTAFKTSVHWEAFARGNRDAPVCSDCHGEHRILGAGDPKSPVFASNIPGETCGRCHANERLNEKYGLRGAKVASFADSFHGLALRAGQSTVANCASCHGVHDILPSSDPRSHIHAQNLAGTCGKCHPGAGTTFALEPVHGDASATSTWAVGWVRFIYLWLIAGTIGGMLLHNALDLSRKLRPHEAGPPPALPREQTARMSRALRWQHGLVMISFPVLVYTGFALKYPESWWATPLLYWETGWELRRNIHRIAGVVLVVGTTWHVAHVLLSARLRACFRGMLPGPADLSVALATVAYYLRLRPRRPHGGTFNYAEKAEYWAFMWGTVVMTLTGFLLWFQNLTLRYLPGWVPDVATAIHFYEAILASLAILVWHFYWVIFDPEVYPMDWTWWDGHAPASRTLERLPEQASRETSTEWS